MKVNTWQQHNPHSSISLNPRKTARTSGPYCSRLLRRLHWLPVRRRYVVFKTVTDDPWVEMSVFIASRRSCQSTGIRTGGKIPRLSWLPSESITGSRMLGCVQSIHLPRGQTSIGQRIFAFHQPTVWNSLLCATITCHWTRSSGGWKLIFSNSDERHPARAGKKLENLF